MELGPTSHRIRLSEARIEASAPGSKACALGDAVVRPEKGEGEKGEKKGGEQADCAAPTLTAATTQPTTATDEPCR
jgi:hypothetical protein